MDEATATGTHRPQSDLGKAVRAAWLCASRPRHTLQRLRRHLVAIYRDDFRAASPLREAALHELVDPATEIRLADFAGRTGNVTLAELIAISTLVAARRPRVVLEIGTFDGNTTLQMALNSAPDATVYTLDLPADNPAAARLAPGDDSYIHDEAKLDRKYHHPKARDKVVQCLGDSATFDFRTALGEDRPEVVFIDGSHSFDYVKNDTEKVFELLAPKGLVLWHDYTPGWPGVVAYLDRLGQTLPLCRLAGTSLVVLDTAGLPESERPACLRRAPTREPSPEPAKLPT